MFCAVEAMSLVICEAVTAISRETSTVTQILSNLPSLLFYWAIYLLLLILHQKNIDVPLIHDFNRLSLGSFLYLGADFLPKGHSPNFILKLNKKIRCMGNLFHRQHS